jgi:hypothetical protein
MAEYSRNPPRKNARKIPAVSRLTAGSWNGISSPV